MEGLRSLEFVEQMVELIPLIRESVIFTCVLDFNLEFAEDLILVLNDNHDLEWLTLCHKLDDLAFHLMCKGFQIFLHIVEVVFGVVDGCSEHIF